ncbi:MAG: Mov34/MPN/PAD-1 family protein [Methanohalobium sp.]|uniref:Mov34/MPN/PAD-1 family protein n=1 Tax=Methanohalobium sp. TaxID=2837493 RepID=UPI00397D7160
MKIKGIESDALNFILKVSESTAPLEFAGLLHADNGVITEVIVLPGTESSSCSAIMRLFMMPNIKSVGSVHSHPSPNIKPSKADLQMFSKTGSHHIIVGKPFDEKSWKCYDRNGYVQDLPVIDSEINNDEIV